MSDCEITIQHLCDPEVYVEKQPLEVSSVVVQDGGIPVGLFSTLNFINSTVENDTLNGRINITPAGGIALPPLPESELERFRNAYVLYVSQNDFADDNATGTSPAEPLRTLQEAAARCQTLVPSG